MSPEAIAATERAIARAASIEQLDALERSLTHAYPGDSEANILMEAIAARRRELGG